MDARLVARNVPVARGGFHGASYLGRINALPFDDAHGSRSCRARTTMVPAQGAIDDGWIHPGERGIRYPGPIEGDDRLLCFALQS